MKKKLLSTILVAALGMSLLVGCGNTGDDGENNPTPTSAAQTNQGDNTNQPDDSNQPDNSQQPDDTQQPADNGWHYTNVESLANPNVSIGFYWEPDDTIKAAISAFEAKYGGTVNVMIVGWNGGATAIQEAMATGDLFDLVFTEGAERFPGDAISELYQPIDEYLDYNVCDQASVDAFLYQGSRYVYTNYAITSPYLVIYNKTIFEEEGMETPVELFNKGEWTYDKYLEYMRYFTRDTDADGEIDQWGIGPRFKRHNFGFANGAMQAYEVGDGTLAVGIDSEAMVQYFNFLNTWGTINTNCPGDGGWLESRQCVMYSEAGPSAGISNEYNGTDEFDFVPLPTYDGHLATTPVWDNGYAMVNGAPNPEGAAVLASMICQYKMDAYEETLAEKYTQEQIDRYYTIMGSIIPQRRKYTDVSNGVGEGEALDGSPAQTIIETYKSQLEGEVEAYNAALK